MQDEEEIFSEEPIGFEPRIAEQIKKKNPTKAFFGFVKKFKIFFIIALMVVAIGIGLYFFLPEVSVSNTKLVNLDTEVRLETGQVVKLKTGEASVEIVNFVNDTCPEGQTCFGSGSTQAVQYSITIDGQKYATGSVIKAQNAAYDIETISSDYETYANIKIIKTN